MKKRVLLLLISGIVVLASLVVFIKSPYFLILLEDIAGRSIDGTVEIGSVFFENMHGLTVTGLVIKGQDGFDLTVPRLTLSFRLRDLLQKHIGEIIVTGPALTITAGKGKAPEPGKPTGPLPFTLDRLSLIDGRIHIHQETGRLFEFTPVNLSLQRDTLTGRTSLSADALIHDLNSEISADAIIDMNTLVVESARVHVPAIDLAMLSGLPFFGFIKDAGVQGTAGLEVEAVPQDRGTAQLTQITAALSIRGLSAHTDTLQINLGERLLNISLKGVHHGERDMIDIEALRVEVTHMRPWTVNGTLERVSSGNPDMDLTIKGSGAALKEISAMLSGPAASWLHETAVSGSAGANISVTGRLASPMAQGVFTVTGESLKAASIFLNSFDVTLPLEYHGGSLIMKDASAVVKEFGTLPGGSFQGRGLSVRGEGTMHAGLRMTFPANETPHVSGTLETHVKDGGFSSADETVIAEGINLDISASVAFPFSFDSIDVSVSSKASGFELLAGKFYGAFSDRAVHFLAEGRYSKADNTFTIVRSTIGLAGIGDMLMTGKVTVPGRAASVDMDITVPDLSGGEAFDFFIRETFREQYPFLARMQIGGQASVNLNVRGTVERFTAQGDFRIAGMEIVDVNSGNSVTGVNMTLPFDISFPEAGPAHPIERFGPLRVGEVHWPPLQVSGLEASAAVIANTLVFQNDIRIPLYGGSVTLSKVSCNDILSPRKSLRLAAVIDGIDLAKAGKSLNMPGFSGSLKGTIPSATVSENRLVTEGEIILELFDGTIRVSGFSADNLFSPIASLRSDIALHSINLGTLTRTFEFGHISGMMRGELKDLVIVNGQAQRFKGYLETYREKGVDQRISVEALKKISILGTGSSVSVLDRGIYQFFRDYRYEKIGLKAALRNDNLVLTGVGDENDSKYLVKGGLLPPKVDVITYNQNISFKELLSRLKRISQIDTKEVR